MTFDPMYKWLGIPPDEQPPNHYRLLGVAQGESDTEVIDVAAKRHLLFLREQASGEQATAAKRLYQQIESARRVLGDAEAKRRYDAAHGIAASSPVRQARRPLASVAPPPPDPKRAAEPQGEWSLRHRDQVEHGPYPIEKLIDAAKAGHIAPDTHIRHPSSTSGQWVLATAVPGIAQYCPVMQSPVPTAQSAGTAGELAANDRRASPSPGVGPQTDRGRRVSIVPRRKKGRREKSFLLVALQVAAPLLMLLTVGIFVAKNPAIGERIAAAFGGSPEPAPSNSQSTGTSPQSGRPSQRQVVPHRRSQPPRDTPRAEPPTPTDSGDGDPEFPDAAPPIRQRSLADLLQPGAADPDDADHEHLKLDFDSTKWVSPIEGASDADRFAVVMVSHCPAAVEMKPDSGELSFDRPLEVHFANMSDLTLDLKLDHIGVDKQIAVVGFWTVKIKGDTESPFSLDRLKNLQKFVGKQWTTSSNQMNMLLAERAEREAFVSMRKAKRLESVNAAKDRIKWINKQLPVLKSAAAQEQIRLQHFMRFATEVQNMHEKSELVIRRTGNGESDNASTPANADTDSLMPAVSIARETK